MSPESQENTKETTTFIKSDTQHRTDTSSSSYISIKVNDDITDLKSGFRRSYIVDLSSTPKSTLKSFKYVPILYPTANYSIYLIRVVQHLFLTIVFDWTTIIAHPLNTLLVFVFFPSVAIVLFFLECILGLVSIFKPNSEEPPVIETWSKLAPSRQELMDNLRSGIESLSFVEKDNQFNLNQAQFLLFLSALLQGRDEKKILEAYKLVSKLKKSMKNDTCVDELQLQNIYKTLKESEVKINRQISEFNLNFMSISELNTIGGPYAGIFWSEEGNFIVIVLKGTTPTNFSEWLTNATFQRADAKPYLFGEIHEGFYSQLFPTDEYMSEKLNKNCPATRVIDAVRQLGEIIRTRIKENNDNPPRVNVYVTGHSLGGALASLLYGRLLKSPQSLGEHCVLKDGTTFASPSVGDNDFASEFSSLCNRSTDEYKTLWRVVCDNDIVPRVPPGHHHPGLRKYLSKVHILNYFHIGDEIRFYQDGSKPSSMHSDIFGQYKEPLYIDEELDLDNWRSMFGLYDPFDNVKHVKEPYNPKLDIKVNLDDRLLINIVRNHTSHRYFAALEKSRKFFEARSAKCIIFK